MIEFLANLTGWAVARIVILQILVFWLLFRLIKDRQDGLVDPFSLAIFFFASGWATVFELFLGGNCGMNFLLEFLAANSAFIFGYLLIAPKIASAQSSGVFLHNKKFPVYGLLVVFFYIATSVVNIGAFGFGVFHENRLDIYRESGGLGVIKRFLDAYMPAAVFVLVYHRTIRGTHRKKLISAVVLGLIGVNTILDGSKSGLVSVFFAYYMSVLWFRMSGIASESFGVRRVWLWVLFAAIIAFFVLGAQLDIADDLSRVGDVMGILFFRLFVAGDVFVLGFPYGAIDAIPLSGNPLIVLFSDFLSTLRLWSAEVVPLGTLLTIYLTPDLVELSGGPNSHVSIYSYYLFGYFGGVILAFIFGAFIGFVRAGFLKSCCNDPVAGSVMVALLLNTANMPIDPAYTMHRLTNIALLLAPFAILFVKLKFNRHNGVAKNSDSAGYY